jgi:IMP dehydrogenase
MNELFTFNDVLIKPKFSNIESRKDVDLSVSRLGLSLALPMISANMDTCTSSQMAIAMANNGAVGCLHRFWDIETNLKEFKTVFQDAGQQAMCSVGLGSSELERAEALVNAGCPSLVLDVAHGAQMSVVKQVKELRKLFGYNVALIVGNFATRESVREFRNHFSNMDGVKIGLGNGSRCKTRGMTGVGIPQLSALLEVRDELYRTGIAIISDGGLNEAGDIAKALGAGAHMVMSGSFFAGTDESPGELVNNTGRPLLFLNDGTVEIDEWVTHKSNVKVFKKYRGSASKESYEVQGKTAKHRSPEGDSTLIPYKGPVADVLQEIEGGLRSAFTYTGSRTLEEFHKNVEFVRVSSNTVIENGTRNGVK